MSVLKVKTNFSSRIAAQAIYLTIQHYSETVPPSGENINQIILLLLIMYIL